MNHEKGRLRIWNLLRRNKGKIWVNRNTPKNRCFWTVLLEKILESPLDCKEIEPINSKGNQPWLFIERTDAEAEAPILWPLDSKSRLTRKDPDAGKDWRQEEKGATEDEMVGWHHWLNRHEFEQTLGGGEGQGSLTSCSPWGCKEPAWLSNWTTRTKENNWFKLEQEDGGF